jgi:endonuclease/exonuclease/phosphatase family metal-dependent hydrolase
MKRTLLVGCLVVAVATGLWAASPGLGAQGVAPLDLRVMTYNLRYASQTPPNAWPSRRPVMRSLIANVAPDVMGTQEGLYAQLKDLASDLPAYDWIGLGRDGGSRGEFMAVFYKRARFEPVAFDHFWLSDTPEVIGSATWGHSNRRMVTWVRFRERATGREFVFWNTHLDHEVEAARQKAASLIRDRLAAADRAIPLILVGDFNCAAGGSRAFEILTSEAGLSDAWTMAASRVNEGLNTFNGFRPVLKEGVRIDWVLLRGRAVVSRAEIVTYSENGQNPSDHFPVVVDLKLQGD